MIVLNGQTTTEFLRSHSVVVWLKIRKHDIVAKMLILLLTVVVWLKIRKHDIENTIEYNPFNVVVWLKIRKHDIY